MVVAGCRPTPNLRACMEALRQTLRWSAPAALRVQANPYLLRQGLPAHVCQALVNSADAPLADPFHPVNDITLVGPAAAAQPRPACPSAPRRERLHASHPCHPPTRLFVSCSMTWHRSLL
jgi:hypothetical protein